MTPVTAPEPIATRPASSVAMPLCQIAVSATHLKRTHFWYRRALGLHGAGAFRHREVEGHAPVSDVPESSWDVWCLVDDQEFFQFEMFEFQRPRMRPVPDDWRPSDIGYVAMGLLVSDFDAALERIHRTSGRLLTAPAGPAGARRVCLRDPEGILLELMEDDVAPRGRRPRPGASTMVQSVRVSVPDLDRARRFWVDGLGYRETTSIHAPHHEALWGLPDARCRCLTLDAGSVVVELVEYAEPVGRARPAGYLITDQGILNVAVGSTNRQEFDAVYQRLAALGYRFNSDPWTAEGIGTVVYVNDDRGFSVELLHVLPDGLEQMGFIPDDRP
jgi:catechol 2,3-dioxygenase-like lactoylglutathione lyase family enzyme